MPDEELYIDPHQAEYEENKKRGYIHVGEVGGLPIYKHVNEAGGWTYYGFSCSVPSIIWDSCGGSKDELILIAKDCYNLELVNAVEK